MKKRPSFWRMLGVCTQPSPPGRGGPCDRRLAGRQVVGMDLHRRRSVLVRMTEDGWKLATARFTNSAAALRAGLARAGENPGSSLRRRYGEQGGGHAGGPL